MSFDTEAKRRNRPSSRNTSQRNIEKIMEDSEEGLHAIFACSEFGCDA